MSRRLQNGESFGWSEILTVMANQRKREMGWMAFVTLFIFWVWMYQFRTVLVITLQHSSFSDLDGFLNTVFFTPEGWTFLAIGTCAGAFLSAVLFSVTVVAMPMLLDRETDFVTAMLDVCARGNGKPACHAHLGGDHLGYDAVVTGARVSGADLYTADPWSHHMAPLPAGSARAGGVRKPSNPLLRHGRVT